MKKLRPIGRESRTFERLANQMARGYCDIRQCQKCTYPYFEGYCCVYCGSDMPSTTKAYDEAMAKIHEIRRNR